MRRFWICLFLLCCLLLCACAPARQPAPSPEPSPTAQPSPEPSPPPVLRLPALDLDGSRQMASFLCGNRALVDGSRLYCYDFDANWEPVLAVYYLRGGIPSGRQILLEDCAPSYLSLWEGRFYFINIRHNYAIESVDQQGEDWKCLAEGPCGYLQLVEGRLRYRRADGRYCEAELDGSEEQVLIDADCYYPYTLGQLVLYQEDESGERLVLSCPADGRRKFLSAQAGYAPLLYGDRLYYSGEDGLYSVDLHGGGQERYSLPNMTGAAEILPGLQGLQIRGLLETPDGLIQWTGDLESASITAQQAYRMLEYTGGGWQVETIYAPDGRIRCFVLSGPTGTVTAYLAGSLREVPDLSVHVNS